jgi:hypothetical protein
VLAAVIILVIAYSALFSPDKARHPVPSTYTLITGEPSSSTGLSRGFSSIVRFRFSEAQEFNPHSISIFMFFLIQLCMRILINVFYSPLNKVIGMKLTVGIDSILSFILMLILMPVV